MDGSFRGARWAWTWKPEGSRFPSSLLEWWSQLWPSVARPVPLVGTQWLWVRETHSPQSFT